MPNLLLDVYRNLITPNILKKPTIDRSAMIKIALREGESYIGGKVIPPPPQPPIKALRVKRSNQEAIPDEPKTGGAAVKGAAGGGLVMGGTHLPSNVEEFVGSTLLTPTVGGAGTLIGGGTRIITKTGSRFVLPALGAAAGFLGGLLFGGGGQTQDQAIEQKPVITPTQTTEVNPSMQTLLDIINRVTQNQYQGGSEIDLGGSGYRYIGGSVASPISTATTYNLTQPITYNIQRTITKSIQRTSSIVGATQEATQEKGLDLLSIALIGGIAFLIFGGSTK